MGETVPKLPPIDKVAIAARMRTVSVTPPAPVMGEGSVFEPPLPTWLQAVAPLSADVLYTIQGILPLTKAEWIYAEPATEHTSGVDAAGRRWHASKATAEAHRPDRHPSQAQRSAQRVREQWVADAWSHAHALALALVAAGVGTRGTGRGSSTLAETVFHLARGAVREPGVPIYDRVPLEHGHGLRFLGHSPRLAVPRPATAERSRAWIRRIECAASHDLVGAPFAQLSRAQGWKDHETVDGRPGPATQAKRAVREGRRLLHDLGAWPWTHADQGRLGDYPQWWTDERFLDPLRRWIGIAWGRLFALRDKASARGARSGARRQPGADAVR